jgi:hypothetical protein
MLIEPTPIAVCLAIETVAVRIAHLLLDTVFTRGFGVMSHVDGEDSWLISDVAQE